MAAAEVVGVDQGSSSRVAEARSLDRCGNSDNHTHLECW